jgi:hypothetical protein
MLLLLLLLLAPESARARNKYSLLLFLRLTTNSEVGCVVLASLLDLVLCKLEKKRKYSLSSSSSLVVVKLISLERTVLIFLFLEFCIQLFF